MVHEDYKQMLVARALSALDPIDNRALNEHLLGCAECRGELDGWTKAASTMSLSAKPMEPSDAVRERIANEIREVRSSTVPEEGSRIVALKRSYSPITGTAASFILVAAGIVLSVLIGWIFLLWRDYALAQAELARLKREIQATDQQLAREREIVNILASPGARVAELSGTSSAPGAHATLAYNESREAMLLARGLPVAPAGKGYQLWFIVDGQPVPGKVFNTDDSGKGTLRDDLPAQMKDKAIFAVTMEPVGGARTPTGSILLRSEL